MLAHYGLANVLGDGEYTKLMSRLIQSQKDPSMKPVWDWVKGTHYADEGHRHQRPRWWLTSPNWNRGLGPWLGSGCGLGDTGAARRWLRAGWHHCC